MNWFSVLDLESQPTGYAGVNRHHDQSEPALYLTRSLFDSTVPYKDLVLGNYSVRGLRSAGSWTTIAFFGSQPNEQHALASPEAGIQRGELVGVRAYAPEHRTWFSDAGAPQVNHVVTNGYMDPSGVVFLPYRSFGAGVLGLQSYFSMNSGFITSNQVSDGGIRMHRRWAANAFSDLLCRKVPLLRNGDVSDLVIGYLGRSPDASNHIAFRTSSNYLSCHAALDPMAAVARNIRFSGGTTVAWSELPNAVNFHLFAYRANTNRPAETETEQSFQSPDPDYFRRPGSGLLRFRSYDGKLINVPIAATAPTASNVFGNLGTALEAQKDFYTCAAARYLQFFTGVHVSLQDVGDTRNPPLSAADVHYRKTAEELGNKLRESQSLRALVEEIINLPMYQKKALRDANP